MKDLFNKEVSHPSYGTVQFNHVSIGGRDEHRLFGSSLRNHMNIVTLTIREGTRYTRFGEDHVMGHNEVVKVELSSAQFAELLTTMNSGSGIPCTIKHRGNGSIENPPNDKVEVDRAQDSFKEKMSDFVQEMEAKEEEIAKVLDKKTINKGDRKVIYGMVTRILQEVKSNRPFALDQFNEAAERVTTAAKAEVEAFVMNTITKTGLKQLKQMVSDDQLLLEDGDKNERP